MEVIAAAILYALSVGYVEAFTPSVVSLRHIPKTGLFSAVRDEVAISKGLQRSPESFASADSARDPLVNRLTQMRASLKNCPQLWSDLSDLCPERRALFDEHLCDEKIDITFAEMNDLVHRSASVFRRLRVAKGSHVAILGENSARWLMVDHGIQLAGGVSAVRGADAPVDELRYIYGHSDSAGMAVLQGPKLMEKMVKDAKAKGLSGIGLSSDLYGDCKTVILMHREQRSDSQIAELGVAAGVNVQVFADLLDAAVPISKEDIPDIGPRDLATIVYTSGTTGRPKGVMLEHGNLIHQTSHRLAPTSPYDENEPLPGDNMVSLLPVWHITERAFELWMASRGCYVAYSSIRTFRNDLAQHKPRWMVLVPRVLEKVASGVQDKFAKSNPAIQALVKLFTLTGEMRAKHNKIAKGITVGDSAPDDLAKLTSELIVTFLSPINAAGNKLVWSKVKEGLGGQLQVIISGGSALGASLESFYEACGMTICVGYGLTECSPLLAFRRSDANLVTPGCCGRAAGDTEIRVVDPDANVEGGERQSLPDGTTGVVLGRGPQVMRGYYKNPEATAKAVDPYGWFDTGDLGRINPSTGDLILTGRVKDTIVLSNGENIEPVPIEDSIASESPLIEQVMLTGQDGRRLVAVTVLNPNELVIKGYLNEADGMRLQEANEKINDPKCTEEDCLRSRELLSSAAEQLRKNSMLKEELMTDIKHATQGFRSWEQVGDFHITLEPFAMVNGQLTQSYKVKRAGVTERYANEL